MTDIRDLTDRYVEAMLELWEEPWLGISSEGDRGRSARVLFTAYRWYREGRLLTKKDVNELLDVGHRATANRYIDPLVRAGLIRISKPARREPRRDGRTRTLILTPRGIEFINQEAERLWKRLGSPTTKPTAPRPPPTGVEGYRRLEQEYSSTLEEQPENMTALAFRAQARAALGKLDDARNDCDRVLATDAHNYTALVTRANINAGQGYWADVIEDLTPAISGRMPTFEILELRARAYEMIGRYDDAVHDLIQARERAVFAAYELESFNTRIKGMQEKAAGRSATGD